MISAFAGWHRRGSPRNLRSFFCAFLVSNSDRLDLFDKLVVAVHRRVGFTGMGKIDGSKTGVIEGHAVLAVEVIAVLPLFFQFCVTWVSQLFELAVEGGVGPDQRSGIGIKKRGESAKYVLPAGWCQTCR